MSERRPLRAYVFGSLVHSFRGEHNRHGIKTSPCHTERIRLQPIGDEPLSTSGQDGVKRFAALLTATLAASFAHAEGQIVRRCDFEVKARCASGDASVTLVDGKLQSIAVDIDWCGLGGGLLYSCSIDSSQGDKGSNWSEAGGSTIISNATPFNATQQDLVKVTVGRYVSIDMENAQSLGRCGAGATLPRAIVIPSPPGPCRVWMNDP